VSLKMGQGGNPEISSQRPNMRGIRNIRRPASLCKVAGLAKLSTCINCRLFCMLAIF
jgi:hypothetical protein